jgi:hypothetical protein
VEKLAKAFDCATPLTASAAAAFAADGFVIVCRYLVPDGWKRLTKGEAEAISAAGLQIVSIFETTADRALGGRAAGLEDGVIALQCAADVGQPAGSCIYFNAADFEPTAEQMPTIIEYIRGCNEATPTYSTGGYGDYEVAIALKNAGVASHIWQTYAWSGGQIADGIQMYQNQNDITLHGIGVDLNECYGNEGGWSTMLLISVSDANKVVGLLEEAYKLGVTEIPLPDGTTAKVDQAEIHRLANVQRTASGQPTV